MRTLLGGLKGLLGTVLSSSQAGALPVEALLGGSQNISNFNFFFPYYIATNRLKALCNSFTVKKLTCGYFCLKF